jgi:integrase
MRRKKILIYPHLCDRKGDISKKWYVELSMRNPKTDVMERRRFEEFNKETINQFSTAHERRRLAAKIINWLNERITVGWTIFDETPECVYDDQLQYSHAARIYREKVNSNTNYKYWVNHYRQEKLLRDYDKKGETLRTYDSRYRVFGNWLIGQGLDKLDISVIDHAVILQYFNYLRTERNHCTHTYKSYQQLLKALFDYVLKQGGIHENPVHDIPDNRQVRDMGAERIEKDDLTSIMQVVDEKYPQLGLANRFMYYCGMRPGYEIRLLKVGDVDLERGFVRVSAEISKTDRDRKIAIPDVFKTYLIDVWHLHVFDKDLYVFGRTGMPGKEALGKNTLRNRFNQVRDQLHLPRYYKFYSFKHTGAVTLAEQGEVLINIRDHLGHTSVSTTEVYLKRHGFNDSKIIRHNFPKI